MKKITLFIMMFLTSLLVNGAADIQNHLNTFCPEEVQLNHAPDMIVVHPSTPASTTLTHNQTPGIWLYDNIRLEIWVSRVPRTPIPWDLTNLAVQITNPEGITLQLFNGAVAVHNPFVYRISYDMPHITFEGSLSEWTVQFTDNNSASGGYRIGHTRVSYDAYELALTQENVIIVEDQDLFVDSGEVISDDFYTIYPTAQNNSVLSNVTIEMAFQAIGNSCEHEIGYSVFDPNGFQTPVAPFDEATTPCIPGTQGFVYTTLTQTSDQIIQVAANQPWTIYFRDLDIPIPGVNQYRVGFARITYDEYDIICIGAPASNSMISDTPEVTFDNTYPVSAKQDEMMSVYPIPAMNTLNINYTAKTASPISIEVIANDGRVLISQQATKIVEGLNTIQLNIEQLPTGYYFIRAYNGDSIPQVQPFIKTQP